MSMHATPAMRRVTICRLVKVAAVNTVTVSVRPVRAWGQCAGVGPFKDRGAVEGAGSAGRARPVRQFGTQVTRARMNTDSCACVWRIRA